MANYITDSVQFRRSVVSNSLWPHGLQCTRPPCPSPTPGVYLNSCPWSRWCHPTISSSAIPFSCLQSFPASGSFQMSQLFASGGQSIGVYKELFKGSRTLRGECKSNHIAILDEGSVASYDDLLLLFSHSVVPDSLQPHGLQHAKLPCPSPSPRICSDSCPLSQWCYLTISSSVVPFSCLQSFPASGSFLMSQFFASGGQSIRASPPVLPMNIQGWFPFGFNGWISLQSKGLSRVFSNTTVQKHQFFSAQPSSQSNSHIHTWPLEKS